VVRDTLRHEWMRELQEDRPAPAREERHLAMEPPAHRTRLERWHSIHGDSPLARYGDSAARARRQSSRESA
jgi:hypothetical protein